MNLPLANDAQRKEYARFIMGADVMKARQDLATYLRQLADEVALMSPLELIETGHRLRAIGDSCKQLGSVTNMCFPSEPETRQ